MRQKEFGGLERARLIDRKLELSFERYRMMGERSEVLEEALFVVEEELPEWLPGFTVQPQDCGS